MALNLPNSAALVLLSAAAVVTWYYSRPPAEAPSVRTAKPLSGYYLHGARFEGTDETGAIAYRIHADALEERPATAQLLLTAVRVDYSPAGAAAWSISAARATAARDGSNLELDGDVELRSTANDGKPPVTIKTTSLKFEPQRSIVETNDPVQLEVGDWHLDGVGLNVHLKDRKVELESDVHGKFAR